MNTFKKSIRDYSKPVMLKLHGMDGLRTYLKIVTTPREEFDAAAAAEKAAENLRKQGLRI